VTDGWVDVLKKGRDGTTDLIELPGEEGLGSYNIRRLIHPKRLHQHRRCLTKSSRTTAFRKEPLNNFYQRQLLHIASLDLALVCLFCEYTLLAQDSFYMDHGGIFTTCFIASKADGTSETE
jgi:hypothetical protein